MPASLLIVLLLGAGFYILLSATAAVRSALTRHRSSPSPPSQWPRVSVVVDARTASAEATLESLSACEYPSEKLEFIPVHLEENSGPTSISLESPVRPVTMETTALSGLADGIAAAGGEIVLAMRPDCAVSPHWVRSMVQQCTPATPYVVAPTVIDHEDYFLPRLQALQRFGLMNLAMGTHLDPLLSGADRVNVALRPAETADLLTAEGDASSGVSMLPSTETATSAIINPDPDAALTCGPVSSFDDYLSHQAQAFWTAFRSSPWWGQGLIVGVWFTHVVLFVSCLGAVAVPAWRQPTLLALLGKMVGDGLLAVPAARHHQQHDLVRSFVPSELLLLISVPFTGVMASLGVGTSPRS